MQCEQNMCSVSTNAWVVGLKQGNLDALFLEEALCLSKVQWRMVRRGVPEAVSCYQIAARNHFFSKCPTSW